MQVKSHGATGSGIKVRKSAGKTDRILILLLLLYIYFEK